jgi:hypothetical protein
VEVLLVRVISIPKERALGRAAEAQRVELTRRSLLKGTGVLMGTLIVGSPLALVAPSTAWAVEFQVLDVTQGKTLLQMGRVLFPHPQLPDAVYALLVKDLDAAAASDTAMASELRAGIASLDHLAGGSFLKSGPKRRTEAVKAMEGQAFFNTVRGKGVTSLYDNQMAYTIFGYEGPAWEKGGYITRGFQDLKWLPNPPTGASPPPFLG